MTSDHIIEKLNGEIRSLTNELKSIGEELGYVSKYLKELHDDNQEKEEEKKKEKSYTPHIA
jgi:hypothetical protein